MLITVEQFKALFPANKQPDAWTAALNAVLPRYDIITRARIAMFLAQCGHESLGFTVLVENLNYSAVALERTWPKRFPPSLAAQYARQPERIANRAYANRMGNGPEESGDGWRHRGRGVIQLTGASNYRLFAQAVGRSYEEIVAYLETREGAVESACWFWSVNSINQLADTGNVEAVTKRINGGINGLVDRQARYKQALKILGVPA